jgi:hypothetical protein
MYGVNHPGAAGGFQLAAEVPDVDPQRVPGQGEVVTPHAVIDQLRGQHATRVEQEELQELILRSRQLDRSLANVDSVRIGIELKVAEPRPWPSLPGTWRRMIAFSRASNSRTSYGLTR